MTARIRTPFRPWCARLYSTRRVSELPSPLQRELFRRVAQPVAVITAHIPDLEGADTSRPSSSTPREKVKLVDNHGATLSSLASISLSPPLVSFSLRLPSRLATFLSSRDEAGTSSPQFRVHLLSTEQESIARAFARQAPLPAPAQPSPRPPANTAADPRSAVGATPSFEASLFQQLEATSLGSMRCRVVRQIPLANLNDSEPSMNSQTAQAGQPRSELFIAQVDDVQLGARGDDAASLLYWDQRYAGVAALGSSGQE
ncbi:hypothetical protein JCM10908_002016 [Rhodotorula pacifica]|uniref:uncharacterized protein n=1 Tax=Rhodotorula pacifica TaxID=1495444 RepID=UPI00317077C0